MSFASPNSALSYSLLAFCLGLALWLMVQAWQRPRTRQRNMRVLAGVVAAGALWLTAFPPLRQLPAARAEVILLTNGYQPDTLRQLLRRLSAGTAVWAYGDATAPVRIRPVGSLLTLAEQRPAVRRLHVLGQGIPVAELPILGKTPILLHPGETFTGFRTAYWPAKLTLGETLQVEGSVAAASPAWVALRADGALRDSVRLPANGGPFHLRYRPKTAGLALYELLLRRPGQPLIAEPVPVEIAEPARPAVLLLAATPSFEFKFLKNYLAEAHYPLALRTSVSRGLVQTDFVNQPATALEHLTPALLSHYSIVVADAATLATLSTVETQALQTAITAGRLGLVTLAEAAPLPRAAPARADFTVLPRPVAQASPQPLTWPNTPAPAKAPMPAQLQARPGLRALATGPGRALMAARRRVGLGFAVVSVVPETFRWALQGQSAVYASFWTQLLTAAMPPPAPAATWRTASRWPRPTQPLTLQLEAAFPSVPPSVRALVGGPAVRLALRQDTRLPEWSTAHFWPNTAGWHEISGPSRTTHRFFVYPPAAWQGPELEARQQAIISQRIAASDTIAPASASEQEPWPATWFFGLFLLAAGYLWLEEKL